MKRKSKELAALAAAIDAKRSEAKVAYKAFEETKVKALADPTVLDTDSTAFTALDDAGKAYDTLCDEIAQMEDRFQRVSDLVGTDEPAAPTTGLVADLMRGMGVPVDQDAGDRRAQQGPLVDVAAFMTGFREWRDGIGSATIHDPRQHFGSMPAQKLIDRARVSEILNATVTTANYPSVPFRRPGIVPALLENLDVLDIITFVPTDAEVIQYVTEAAFTNLAAETAEASAAPEGAENFTLASVSCQWIPFTIPETRQILADEPRLQAFIQNRIVWGVRDRLMNQVIKGDGTGQNLTGLLNWANILDQLKQTTGSPLQPQVDAVHKAKTQVIVNTKGMYTPRVFGIHPTDFEELVLTKDTLGRYIFGGPQSDGAGTIWGMLPVVHPMFATGKPWVGDMAGCEGYIREDVSLAVTDSHSDHFTKGIVDFLASGRFAFAVLQPKAFCTISNFNA